MQTIQSLTLQNAAAYQTETYTKLCEITVGLLIGQYKATTCSRSAPQHKPAYLSIRQVHAGWLSQSQPVRSTLRMAKGQNMTSYFIRKSVVQSAAYRTS